VRRGDAAGLEQKPEDNDGARRQAERVALQEPAGAASDRSAATHLV
jgi:hypothetical protein